MIALEALRSATELLAEFNENYAESKEALTSYARKARDMVDDLADILEELCEVLSDDSVAVI